MVRCSSAPLCRKSVCFPASATTGVSVSGEAVMGVYGEVQG